MTDDPGGATTAGVDGLAPPVTMTPPPTPEGVSTPPGVLVTAEGFAVTVAVLEGGGSVPGILPGTRVPPTGPGPSCPPTGPGLIVPPNGGGASAGVAVVVGVIVVAVEAPGAPNVTNATEQTEANSSTLKFEFFMFGLSTKSTCRRNVPRPSRVLGVSLNLIAWVRDKIPRAGSICYEERVVGVKVPTYLLYGGVFYLLGLRCLNIIAKGGLPIPKTAPR